MQHTHILFVKLNAKFIISTSALSFSALPRFPFHTESPFVHQVEVEKVRQKLE